MDYVRPYINNYPIDELVDLLSFKYDNNIFSQVQVLLSKPERQCTFHHELPIYLKVALLEFSKLSDVLTEHRRKEDEVIFPYIKAIFHYSKKNINEEKIPSLMLDRALENASKEHDAIVGGFEKIRQICRNYIVPEDAGDLTKLYLNNLQQLEMDYYQQIYIEDKVLFPRCKDLEKRLTTIDNQKAS